MHIINVIKIVNFPSRFTLQFFCQNHVTSPAILFYDSTLFGSKPNGSLLIV